MFPIDMDDCYVMFVVIASLFRAYHVTGTWAIPTSYSQEGDITLGGLFPLHYSSYRKDNYSLLSEPTEVQCERYNFLGFRWMQAMIFAIDQINNRSDLLPNHTLGFQIFDTCNTHSIAVSQSLYMVHSLKTPNTTKVSAVIGPTASDKSTVVSNILSVFDIPQVSYASTSRLLSNKNIYNSFFRTIPNDDEQTTAIVDLLLRHDWTWVGAIAGDDDYGRPGIAKLKQKAKEKGICIEYTGYVSETMEPEDLERIAKEVKKFNATVFVLFISATHLEPLVQQLSLLNVSEKVWIASEAWATSDTIRNVDGRLMEGTLGIATRGGVMDGFRSFLRKVSPKTQPNNPFVREFWENTFNCFCQSCQGAESNHTINLTSSLCSGSEDFDKVKTTAYLNWSGVELEKSYNVYLAVYVIAHALDNITKCEPGFGLLQDGKCPDIDKLETWQMLKYMKHVRFDPLGQELPFYFDENGDPQASYKLVSWVPKRHFGESNGIEFVRVGNYSAMKKPRWSINYTNLFWKKNRTEPPVSVCSDPCPVGTYRSRLSSDCCYECRACAMDEYSVAIDSDSCMKCIDFERANANRTGCIPKLREYVRWSDAYGISLCCFVVLGVVITFFVSGVFFKKRNTPLVKATNTELSFLLFFSIFCCFLTPLFYIVEPQDWSCRARTVSFSLSFTFSVAAILVKTLRVLSAFEARVPVRYNKKTKWLGEHLQILVVLSITLLQAVICIVWLLVDPPTVMIKPSIIGNDSVSIQCDQGSLGLMISVYVYLSLLALTAFIFAFRARKLPENFNEAKFITFSMLIFFIVWISFIPAYISTTGSMTTVVNCIAILASTFGFIGCIFFPKIYVIFVTPDRNTVQEVRKNTVSHAFRTTRWHSSIKTSTDTALTSPKISQEKRETFRKKYVEKYNALSPVHESKPVVELSTEKSAMEKDSTVEVGIGKNVLSSFNTKNKDQGGSRASFDLKANLKPNIQPTRELNDEETNTALESRNKLEDDVQQNPETILNEVKTGSKTMKIESRREKEETILCNNSSSA